MCINDRHESAKRLFAEHVAASFPNECEDLEIAGVDLEELNGTIVGCAAPFISRSGYQAAHQSELRRCREELDTVLPRLKGYSQEYYTRLRTLADLILEQTGA
jgi:hypothetical protein